MFSGSVRQPGPVMRRLISEPARDLTDGKVVSDETMDGVRARLTLSDKDDLLLVLRIDLKDRVRDHIAVSFAAIVRINRGKDIGNAQGLKKFFLLPERREKAILF